MTYCSIIFDEFTPSLIDKAEELTILAVGQSLSPHCSVMDFTMPFLQWIVLLLPFSSAILSHGNVLQQYRDHFFQTPFSCFGGLFPHLHHIVDSP